MGAYKCDRKFVLDDFMQESFSKIKLKSILSKILAMKYVTNKNRITKSIQTSLKGFIIMFFLHFSLPFLYSVPAFPVNFYFLL